MANFVGMCDAIKVLFKGSDAIKPDTIKATKYGYQHMAERCLEDNKIVDKTPEEIGKDLLGQNKAPAKSWEEMMEDAMNKDKAAASKDAKWDKYAKFAQEHPDGKVSEIYKMHEQAERLDGQSKLAAGGRKEAFKVLGGHAKAGAIHSGKVSKAALFGIGAASTKLAGGAAKGAAKGASGLLRGGGAGKWKALALGAGLLYLTSQVGIPATAVLTAAWMLTKGLAKGAINVADGHALDGAASAAQKAGKSAKANESHTNAMQATGSKLAKDGSTVMNNQKQNQAEDQSSISYTNQNNQRQNQVEADGPEA